VMTDSGKRRGTVTCLDAVTGKTLWESKLPGGAQQYYASPTLVGDKLYAAREEGTVFCATVKMDGLGETTTNRLEETLIASPVAIGNKLLLRGRDHLFCIGE
jgi:outer membrane protein assembly factor BamB